MTNFVLDSLKLVSLSTFVSGVCNFHRNHFSDPRDPYLDLKGISQLAIGAMGLGWNKEAIVLGHLMFLPAALFSKGITHSVNSIRNRNIGQAVKGAAFFAGGLVIGHFLKISDDDWDSLLFKANAYSAALSCVGGYLGNRIWNRLFPPFQAPRAPVSAG